MVWLCCCGKNVQYASSTTAVRAVCNHAMGATRQARVCTRVNGDFCVLEKYATSGKHLKRKPGSASGSPDSARRNTKNATRTASCDQAKQRPDTWDSRSKNIYALARALIPRGLGDSRIREIAAIATTPPNPKFYRGKKARELKAV
eukprot:4417465-Prymnesium_polylepis.2